MKKLVVVALLVGASLTVVFLLIRGRGNSRSVLRGGDASAAGDARREPAVAQGGESSAAGDARREPQKRDGQGKVALGEVRSQNGVGHEVDAGGQFVVRSQERWDRFEQGARDALGADAELFISIHRDLCIEHQQRADLIDNPAQEVDAQDKALLLMDAFKKRDQRVVSEVARFKDLSTNPSTRKLSIELSLPWVGACMGPSMEEMVSAQVAGLLAAGDAGL